jgi:membrane-bound inhibitor of C-type lysozyme
MPLRHRFARLCCAILLPGLMATSAMAQQPTAGIDFDQPITVRYRCDHDKALTVRYFNSPDNQLAAMRLDGKPLLFVSVLTGSGARYAHGKHLWITKGDEGRLEDLTQGPNGPPVYENCRATK